MENIRHDQSGEHGMSTQSVSLARVRARPTEPGRFDRERLLQRIVALAPTYLVLVEKWLAPLSDATLVAILGDFERAANERGVAR